ncbi:uncharacterized protein LOC129221074 [Uloborus diversus]|uniref:uncharacterized protein LOC129221074 n=1 Tax=Uloborus diversus TaxID=327109 RepID=UPI00240A47C1|nr:uncharacterized protein LOC129221074 [Uloborus diversus]
MKTSEIAFFAAGFGLGALAGYYASKIWRQAKGNDGDIERESVEVRREMDDEMDSEMSNEKGKQLNDAMENETDIELTKALDKQTQTEEAYSLDNDLPYDAGSTPKYTRGWKAARNEDRDRRPVRQRTTGARRDSGYIQSKNGNVITEIKRNPKIVKYIADKNGFAVREDLVQPLQQTIERTRLESRPRIVTAPRTPLSQVVSSAIRVTGGQEGGKFRPKVIDMKVGDQTVGFHKMQYTLGEVKKGYL